MVCSCSSHMAIWLLFSICEWKIGQSPAFDMTEVIRDDCHDNISVTLSQICWIAGVGTGTYGVGNVFPTDDLCIGFDTYTNCGLIYILHKEVRLMGCSTSMCLYWYLTDGERGGLWWPTLSGHWLSCNGCWQHLLNMKCLMYGLLLLYLSTSQGCFCPRTFLLKKWIGIVTIMVLLISYLHTKLRVNSRSVSGSWFSSWCLWP